MSGEPSLARNAALNTLQTVSSVVFPLITYPYVSRVLGVGGIGAVNYTASVIGFVALVAAFGTSSYAVREGARLRDDPDAFQRFFSQMWTINLVATLLSYAVLMALLLVPAFHGYMALLAVQGLQMASTWIGPAWVTRSLEDFEYVAKRAVAVQIACLALTFLLVRSPGDTLAYAFVLTASYIGTGVANLFWCRGHVRMRLTCHPDLRTHLRPMAQVFVTTLTTAIYVNADQAMLGLMAGDASVGLYGCATKVYTVVKNVFWAALSVAVPRMSKESAELSDAAWRAKATRIFELAMMVFLPLSVGLFMLAEPAVLFLGGEDYLPGARSLRILAVALAFSSVSVYLNNIVAVPQGRYSVVTRASAVTAVENVLLNAILIPAMRQDGAALTTLAAEATAAAMVFRDLRLAPDWGRIGKVLAQCSAGCAAVALSCVIGMLVPSVIVGALASVLLSVASYAAVLTLLGNERMLEINAAVRAKL